MSKPDEETRRLAEATEKQLQLPPGLVSRFIENGGQLDKRAAATVLDAYGIDPKLNKRNSVDAVGLALQDALQRNGNDPTLAIAELYSGQDRNRWSKGTNDFAVRVVTGPVQPATAPAGRRSGSGMQLQQQAGRRSGGGLTAPPPAQSAPVEGMTPADPAEADAQQSMMPDEEIAAVEAAAPAQAAPAGAPPAGEGEAVPAGPKTLDAYRTGAMSEEDRAEFERLVQTGALTVPADFQVGVAPMEKNLLQKAAEIPGAIKEAVTGDKRRTAETERLPDWMTMPSTEKLSQAGGLAFMTASPAEALQMLQAEVPGVQIRQDEKGNLIARDPIDGLEYAVKPGFRATDIPRAVVSALPFLATGGLGAAGAAAGGLGAVATGGLLAGTAAATQAGIEGLQASQGGEFNGEDVLMAGLLEPATMLGGAALSSGAQAVGRVGKAAASKLMGKPAAQAAGQVAEDVTQVAAQGVDDVTRVVPPPTAAPAAAAGDVAGEAARAAPIDPASLAEMLVTAKGKGVKADAARAELARMAAVDTNVAQAAERLGMDLSVDMMSGNEQFKNLAGLARSKIGSEAQAEFAASVDDIVKQADEVMKDFGATVVEGAPSSAAVSGRVLDRMKGMQAELKQAASAAHETIAEAIPKATKVNVSGALAEMQKIVSEVGANSLSTAERKLQAVLSDPGGVTYQALKRQKDLIGKALEGQDSPFSNMATGDLKRLYGLIAQAQEEAVRGVGGDALVKQLKAANALTVAQKGVEERIVAGFGKEANGDLADKMTRAITAAKGEKSKPLDDLLAIVPEDMHREVIATAVTKLVSGKDGVFSPEKFVDFYQAMRSNPAATAKITKVIGGDVANVWRDLFEVSKAVATANPKVKFTGIGNQELEAAVMGNGLIGKILTSSVARKGVAAGAGAAAGAMTASPLIAGGVGVVANAGLDALMNARASVLPTMGKLFIAPEFKALAIAASSQAAESPAIKEAVRKVVTTKTWRDYAKAVNLSRDPKVGERFLLAALQSGKGQRE